MKALILAAGLGTRLAPITDEYPKCMTEVAKGKTIIQKQIENLLANGINDITVITGYKSELLVEYISGKFKNINFIENINYFNTNNMYSALLGKTVMYNSEFIMMNADVYFDEGIIGDLLCCNSPDAIVVDVGSYIEESMKVVQKDNKLVKISKQILEYDALGCSIDVYKFSKESGKRFFDKCDEYINGKNELKLWSEVALNDIMDGCCFCACPLSGRWVEIDNHEDLAAARELFSE